MEIETLIKPQRETTLKMESLGKIAGVTDTCITTRIVRGDNLENTIEDIDTTVKENTKSKKLLTQNIQEIHDTKINKYRRE